MTTTPLPRSLLTSACIPTLVCDPPVARGKRNQNDLIVRAQTGDQDAFSELYLEHKKRVFGICMRMVRDVPLAEDLAQEAFLQVYRRISMFRGDSAFTTWLHRIAVNTVLMHLRKRALTVVSLDNLMEDIHERRTAHGLAARDLVQAGAADRLDIDRALTVIAPGYRSIYLLHEVEGFEHNEIAGMLNCTCGNTKSQLYKARRALRSALAPKRKSVSHSSDLFLVPPQRENARPLKPKLSVAALKA